MRNFPFLHVHNHKHKNNIQQDSTRKKEKLLHGKKPWDQPGYKKKVLITDTRSERTETNNI